MKGKIEPLRGNYNLHLENGHLQMGHLKCPVFHVLNFRGWIKLIYDKTILIYCVENEFNPTSEVQNIENEVFQNAPFGNFQMGGTVASGLKLVYQFLNHSIQNPNVAAVIWNRLYIKYEKFKIQKIFFAYFGNHVIGLL